MKTRICPLCDQPMKKAHHCDSCNSFIWKPMYLDIHYSTGNTYETDCSYDAIPHDYEYHENGSVTMMPLDDEKSRKKRFRGVDEIEFPTRTSSRDYEESAPAPSKKKGGCLKKLALIIFILSLLSTVVELIFSMVADVGSDLLVPELQPEISIEEEWNIEDWVDPGTKEIEFTEDEVMAMGEECTAYSHMDVVWTDVVLAMEGMMDGVDSSQPIEYSESTYNWAYDYGNEVDTYFTSSRMYNLEFDAGYYEIGWDTYSGRVHYVNFDVYGSDAAELYYVQTMYALLYENEHMVEEFQNGLSVAEDEGYVFYDTEGYEIYISYYDGNNDHEPSYYISITKLIYE